MPRCDLSIIIPVFREEVTINRMLARLFSLPYEGPLEIILADGDEEERTMRAVTDPRVKKVRAKKGRGAQMNAGASAATGEVLLFLHADTELPPAGLTRLISVANQPEYAGGSFDLGIGDDKLRYRVIERVASWRSRITKMPYGDQAIFVKKEWFLRLGGFHERGIMEDVDFTRRLRKSGGRLYILHEKVKTSPRRWEEEGLLRCTLRNWTVLLLYLLGVSPERLTPFYKDYLPVRRENKA